MLQNVDNEQRSRWMGLLARAPVQMLQAWAARQVEPCCTDFTWLRRPETGLVMVRARAGGSGEKFNLGEMTLTRCTLRLRSGATGIAYVQGRSHKKAEIAALADALLQSRADRERVERELIEPLRARMEAESGRMQRKAQATRVEFFTVARQAGA